MSEEVFLQKKRDLELKILEKQLKAWGAMENAMGSKLKAWGATENAMGSMARYFETKPM